MYFFFINHSCQKLVIQIFVHLFQFLGFMHVFGSLPASVDVSTVAFFCLPVQGGKVARGELVHRNCRIGIGPQ